MAEIGRLAGTTLAGRYDVLDLLGAGGMGEVYRARDRELDELVALKVLRANLARDLEAWFRSEVKLARRVTHRGVARIFELNHADDVTFCTMELIDGESLARRLERERRLPVATAVAIAAALCDALDAAHDAGVIHRDLKPDNVMLARDGRVVLTDFGIAAARHGDGMFSGTPRYMAPEQARGETPSPAADVYALGVVLFEMLTGRAAFGGPIAEVIQAKQTAAHVELRPEDDVEPALAQLVTAATALDPRARPAGGRAMRAALAPWLAPAPRPADALAAPTRVDPSLLPTVTVCAPDLEHAAAPHLTYAFHHELLRVLAERPRLRVVARHAQASAERGAVVSLRGDGDALVVALCTRGLGRTSSSHANPALDVRVALDAARLELDAETVGLAIAAAATGTRPEPIDAGDRARARDLALRAHFLSRRDRSDLRTAVALYAEAAALVPGDPGVLAGMAIAKVRLAFFHAGEDPALIDEADALARRALAEAPGLAEAHLAGGHVAMHQGDAAVAASHFRAAIACEPHLAEAHGWLGSLLLEAGYLLDGAARVEEALAAGDQLGPRWDLVRALALDGRWAEADAMLAPLLASSQVAQRWGWRARLDTWRRDPAALRAIMAESSAGTVFERELVIQLCEIALAREWGGRRDAILARLDDRALVGARRKAFVAQLVAEAAAWAGDVDAALGAAAQAVDRGLFDRLWIERCPALDGVRGDPRFAALRDEVKRRADAIQDALRGDLSDVPSAAASRTLAQADTLAQPAIG